MGYAPGLQSTLVSVAVMAGACTSIAGDSMPEPAGAPDAGVADAAPASDGGSGVVEVVDVEVPGTIVWTDTGVDVVIDEHIGVTATGMVDTGDGDYGPDGDPTRTSSDSNLALCTGHAALIGRVGDDGDPFRVGAQTTFVATRNDRLYLGVNDRTVDDNGGQFAAGVAIDLLYTRVTMKNLTVPGNVAWSDTGIDLAVGQQLTITARGTVVHSVSSGNSCDPSGEPDTTGHDANPLKCSNHAALIGRIGDGGARFLVGRTYSAPAAASGRLLLGINDDELGNNSGAYTANVAVTDR